MKLVWAFNPFDDSRKLQQQAVAIVKSLTGARDSLEAVYVASPVEIELATAFDVPFAARFTTHPTTLVERAIRKLGFKKMKATVLTHDSVSLTSSVRALAAHTAAAKADITLLASHARKGVSRLFLGSFAETLVPLSKTDLLVFHENTRSAKRAPRTLLFAHDLTREGDRGFEKALGYAKRWKCALHVIHVPEPAYGIHFDDQNARVESYRKRVRTKVAALEARLKRARVEGSVVIDMRWAPISELILSQAQRVHADLLLVFAKSGRLAGMLGGSVTRQVLRASVAPVLVLKAG